MSQSPNILALGGSIRASGKLDQVLLHVAETAKDLSDYLTQIETYVDPISKSAIPNPKTLSNTEILAGATLVSARLEGANIEYFSLTKLFPKKDSKLESFASKQLGLHEAVNYTDWLKIHPENQQQLIHAIKKADGIIITSPVYFGDRSSVANKFLQISQVHQLLDGKVVGCISAGAKRNGGQETTNIYMLYELLNLNALVVGNGPPTAQYGGTAVGGDIGTVMKDEFGLKTALGVGKRVAQAAKTIQKANEAVKTTEPVMVTLLICADNPQQQLVNRVQRHVKQLQANHPHCQFEIINLLTFEVFRCLACNICPIPELIEPEALVNSENDPYACVIQNSRDSMETIREKILNTDAIILCGLNQKEAESMHYRYQAFTERTRFIRRNNFEMTNLPITSYCLNEVGAKTNALFDLKVMTSYMRHNTLLLKPIEEYFLANTTVVEAGKDFDAFLTQVSAITAARRASKSTAVQYQAGGLGGYEDTRLDETSAERL